MYTFTGISRTIVPSTAIFLTIHIILYIFPYQMIVFRTKKRDLLHTFSINYLFIVRFDLFWNNILQTERYLRVISVEYK